MKTLRTLCFVVIIASLFAAQACKKQSQYSSSAIITGYDIRGVDCSGSLFLKFRAPSGAYSDSIYDVTNTASQMGIVATDTFPIRYDLNWASAGQPCGFPKITITGFHRQ